MAFKLLRERAIDLFYPDILSLTDYSVSPVLAQRDSDVVRAQGIVRQYFAENFLSDNPAAGDLVKLLNSCDSTVKCQQACECQAVHQTQCSYPTTDPVIQGLVKDFTGLLDKTFGVSAVQPFASELERSVNLLEDALAWITAQVQHAGEFVLRSACCMMLFSDKLKPKVFYYVNGQLASEQKPEVLDEMVKFTQDLSSTAQLLKQLDFTDLVRRLDVKPLADTLDNIYMTIMNQQLQQVFESLRRLVVSRYLPVINKFKCKCLKGKNPTLNKLASQLERAKDEQIQRLYSMEFFNRLADEQKRSVLLQIQSQIDAALEDATRSLLDIQIPEGTKIGDLCLGVYDYLSEQIEQTAQGIFLNLMDLLKQFYQTKPKFPDLQKLENLCVNTILRASANALLQIADTVSKDISKYAELQRTCFGLDFRIDVPKAETSSSEPSASTQSAVQDLQRMLKYGSFPLESAPVVLQAQPLQTPSNVSSKLRDVLSKISKLFGGG